MCMQWIHTTWSDQKEAFVSVRACAEVSVGSMHTLDGEGGDGLLEEYRSAFKKSPTVNEANAVFIRLFAVPGSNEFGKLSQAEYDIPIMQQGGCSQPVGLHLFAFSNHHLKDLAFGETICKSRYYLRQCNRNDQQWGHTESRKSRKGAQNTQVVICSWVELATRADPGSVSASRSGNLLNEFGCTA